MRINDVARHYGVTKRTLRYYEEIGLLQSQRRDDHEVRHYDEAAIARLEQILLLRRLGFPIRRISDILLSGSSAISSAILMERLQAIQEEIDVLVSLRGSVSAMLRLCGDGVENLNLYQLLKEQVYLHKKLEGVLQVEKFDGDVMILEFGIDVVPYASRLIDGIKALRAELESRQALRMPLIRIRDVEELASYDYRLMALGLHVAGGSVAGLAETEAVQRMLADVERLVLHNGDKLCGN